MTAVKTSSSLLRWSESDPSPTFAGKDEMPWANQTLYHAEWLNRILEQIQNLDRLQLNWDSYGAVPVSAKSIREARRVAERISRYDSIEVPDISATPDGIVAFGWDVGDWSLDAEIELDGQILYAYLNRGDKDCDHEGVFSGWRQFAEFMSLAF